MDLIVLVIKIILWKTMCLQRKIFIYISQWKKLPKKQEKKIHMDVSV